jgi:hypothetical protein
MPPLIEGIIADRDCAGAKSLRQNSESG